VVIKLKRSSVDVAKNIYQPRSNQEAISTNPDAPQSLIFAAFKIF